jgi:4-oxalomesaconate tautomerase
VAAQVAGLTGGSGMRQLDIEHPTGFFTVVMDVVSKDGSIAVKRSALVRTARKLMSGEVFVPVRAWNGA